MPPVQVATNFAKIWGLDSEMVERLKHAVAVNLDAVGVPKRAAEHPGAAVKRVRDQPDWEALSSGSSAVHLDADVRADRQRTATTNAIREMIGAHRHLFGEEITSVKDLFQAIDTDGGGTIERAEFDAGLARLVRANRRHPS